MAVTLEALCTHLGLTVPAGQGALQLVNVRPLGEASKTDLSFFDNQLYKHGARTTQAAAVLVRAADAETLPEGCIALVTPQPYVAFAKALQLMYPAAPVQGGTSQFAVVSASAKIHPTARIEPYAVIYENANIGPHAHIGAHTVIGPKVAIGAHCHIGAHVTVNKAIIGDGCILHPGVRIGQDGFGFAMDGADIIKVPQIGKVIIGTDVEIGANTTIDCGAIGDTIIEDMVKIDNQVQIAHNVKIGRGTRIVAQSGVAGSASLGRYNVIGGQSGVVGHVVLADKIMVAARSAVTKSISSVGQVVAGTPAVPIQEWRRSIAILARLTKSNPLRGGSKPAEEEPEDKA
jgi:UDP-3-O-[3-hydroxymyristoyl] glucosamine N-acyltransferase